MQLARLPSFGLGHNLATKDVRPILVLPLRLEMNQTSWREHFIQLPRLGAHRSSEHQTQLALSEEAIKRQVSMTTVIFDKQSYPITAY